MSGSAGGGGSGVSGIERVVTRPDKSGCDGSGPGVSTLVWTREKCDNHFFM